MVRGGAVGAAQGVGDGQRADAGCAVPVGDEIEGGVVGCRPKGPRRCSFTLRILGGFMIPAKTYIKLRTANGASAAKLISN